MLVYPLLYFVASFLIGRFVNFVDTFEYVRIYLYEYDVQSGYYIATEIYEYIAEFVPGGPAYVYLFMDPNWYWHISLYIIMIFGLAIGFLLMGMGLVKIKRYLDRNFYPRKQE